MNNDTTVASNDESRKKATNNKVADTNELKTNYVSDEDVRNDIKNKWGEDIYIAAIDPQFENIIAQEDTTTSSTTGSGRRKRIKVTSKVAIALNHLINNPLVTIGAKPEKGKFKKARQEQKANKSTKKETKREEQEM